MKRLTAEFTLPSGVPVMCSQLYGDHYEILTSGQYKESDMMLEFILSLLISVGSKTFKHNAENHKENLDFVRNMRATDKEHILATVRQATMDYEPEFTFPHKWVDSDGRNHKEEFKVTLNEVDDPSTMEHIETLVSEYGEEHRAFFTDLNKDGTFRTTPSYHRATEYSDLQQSYEVVTPKSGLTIQLSYLAGWGERFLSAQKNPSTNSLIEARKPKYKDEAGNWVIVRVRDLHMKDIEYLRGRIKAYEGSVDMVLSFENPKDKTNLVELNLLSQTAFFFPSGAL